VEILGIIKAFNNRAPELFFKVSKKNARHSNKMEETNQVTNYLNEEKQQKLYRFNYAVHKAKGALFFAAGLSLIPMVLSYSRAGGQLESSEIILFVLLFCSFIGLSFFASKKPFTALVIAALVYVAYFLMLALPFLFSQGVTGFLWPSTPAVFLK
jgi:hypothetical protein